MDQVAQNETWFLWSVLGAIGAVTFYARFYIQWLYSELRGRSVIPISFWYLSGVGSLFLLIYSVSIPSPVGALSHSFNSVVYSRNLIHVWRESGTLSRARTLILHTLVTLTVIFGMGMLALTWKRELNLPVHSEVGVAPHVLLWIIVGGVGQGLFALRFVIQWLATERARRSIVPNVFWYISVAASLLLMASHASRQEWIFVIGLASSLLVYARNIVLIRLNGEEPDRAVA